MPVGEFLEDNDFGFAVIVVSSGMEGDSQKELLLSQARAMVLRKFLVENFGLTTVILRRWEWANRRVKIRMLIGGSIQILIFPSGTEIPASEPGSAGASSTNANPR